MVLYHILSDVKVSFDKNGNVISENTKEAKQKAVSLEIESKKESIANLEKTRDSEAFKYKEVTETDVLGNKKKVKRLKTPQELKESTDKINAQIDKSKAELRALEQQSTSTTQSEIEAKKADIERRRQEALKKFGTSEKQTSKNSVKVLGVDEYVSRELMELAYSNDSGNNPEIGGGGQTLNRIIERGGYSKEELSKLLKPEIDKINAKYDAEYVEAVKKGETDQRASYK
jgi:hypothetical protein